MFWAVLKEATFNILEDLSLVDKVIACLSLHPVTVSAKKGGLLRKVANDKAKRGVKLNTYYATILTDNDEQRAALIQAIKKHRLEFSYSKKFSISKLFSI